MRILSTSAASPRWIWLCIPAIAYALVVLAWHSNGTDELTGDEFFYLNVAESIVGDFDFDVSNNLQEHGYRSPGWDSSHSVETPHGWFSVHSIGLSALLALPWGLGGILGARLTMAALCGFAVPLLYRIIERIWQSPRNSLLMSMALALSMPLLNASNQFYPDFWQESYCCLSRTAPSPATNLRGLSAGGRSCCRSAWHFSLGCTSSMPPRRWSR